MPERTLEHRYRLLAALFRDEPSGRSAAGALGGSFDEALALLVHVLAHDLALPASEIDAEHLRALMRTLLPGRLAGREPYRLEMPALLESFIVFASEREGSTQHWQWPGIIEEEREAFQEALRNPARAVPAARIRHEPDRRPAPKLGRNDPCFCGSGRKYKHCCMKLLP